MARRVSSPELIGRAAPLAALDEALAEVRRGHGRLVLIEGDAGIGKTRLVDSFAASLDDVRILTGGGIPLGGDAPYAPMIDIFRALAGLHPPAAAQLLLENHGGPVDPFGATRLLSAAAAAVRVAAETRPLLLVVEDLHWADPSTRDVVTFLARAIRASAVLLLVTVRAEELDASRPIGALIGELGRLPHGRRLTLAPLAAADVATQVQSITGVAPSDELLERVLRRAAGNPFFTEEILAAGADTTTVPASVREVVLGRVARLGEPGRRLLQAAAVLGRVVGHDLLHAVAEPSPEAVDAVVRHRLLQPRGDGYAFRHPLIQEAVYGDLLPAPRRALHARAAAALASQAPPPTPADRAGHAVQVAFHWHAAGDPGPALAATVAAADLARAAHAPAVALGQYDRALAAWSTVDDAASVARVDEVTLLERAAEAASAGGANGRAQEFAQRVLTHADAGTDPVRTALRLERLGRFSWLAGDVVTSWRAYAEALDTIPDEPSAARARVLGATAQSLMLRSRHLASRDYARQAVTVARAVGARAEEAHACDTLGTNLGRLGEHDDGIAMVECGLRLAREVGDAGEIVRCHINLAEQIVDARRVDEALRAGEEGIAEVVALGYGRVYAAPVLGSIVKALFLAGRWDEIGARIGLGLDDGMEALGTLPPRIVGCRLALVRGDLDATVDLTAMAAVPGALDDIQFGPSIHNLNAHLAAARGDLDTARTEIDAALTHLATTDAVGVLLDHAAGALRIEADALDADRRSGRRGDRAGAEARARVILAQANEAVHRSAPFALLQAYATAEYSRIAGPVEAERWSELAHHPLADPYLVGYAQLRYAAGLLSQRRARAEAARALGEADRIAHRLGAAPLRAEVARLARNARIELGPVSPTAIDAADGRADPAAPAPATDPAGLTAREREVIALLHDGLSNADIGRTLYISEKTASVHVSNIMRKLGVRSRVQAAAAGARYRDS